MQHHFAIIPQPFLTVLEDILTFWHDLVGGSWGWAIILLTFTIRIFILPLTFKSVKSMQKLQVLQPEMKKIQERYKDDKQRMNQEMMKFYQENKVNPLGSCLPLLLQIPFFIALFELLRSESFQADIAGNAAFGPIDNLAEPLTRTRRAMPAATGRPRRHPPRRARRRSAPAAAGRLPLDGGRSRHSCRTQHGDRRARRGGRNWRRRGEVECAEAARAALPRDHRGLRHVRSGG